MDASQDSSPTLKLVIGIAVVSVLVSVAFMLAAFANAEAWTERGARGDWFGGHLSAAGSLAAAVLLFGAVILQSRELALQRAELKETRREMEAARKVYDAQREAMERQVKVAAEAATVSQIIEALKYRKPIDDQIANVESYLSNRDQLDPVDQLDHFLRERQPIDEYLDALTLRATLNDVMRPYLRKLAGLKALDQDSAGGSERPPTAPTEPGT